MVEKEIESLHSDHSVTPGREVRNSNFCISLQLCFSLFPYFFLLQRWFKKLPPVLTFELSRFEFNTQLGRPEKIHKKLEFPPVIYMDRCGLDHLKMWKCIDVDKLILLFPFMYRYLHRNIKQTNERRGEVKKLKEQLATLQQKLEWWVYVWEIERETSPQSVECRPYFECLHSYKNYGSGPTKYPLADMLQFVLEFATTKPSSVSPAEDLRPNSSSPSPCSENDVHVDDRLDVLRVDFTRGITEPTGSASSLIISSLPLSVNPKMPISQRVSYPVASGHQYTSPSHSADPQWTARHCRPRTASATRSCTPWKRACSVGEPKWRTTSAVSWPWTQD